MKTLANIISYIFHPVFMPTIGMYIFLKYGIFIAFTNTYIGFVSVVLFVFTCLLPLFTIMTLKMLKMVTSIHLPTHRERRFPILASACYFLLAYYLIKSVHVVAIIDYIMACGVFTLIAVLIINFYYKLSIHMAAIGSLTGMLAAVPKITGADLFYFIAGAFLVSGLVGYARLKLKAHSNGEVAVGFITGFLTQYLLLSIFEVLNF